MAVPIARPDEPASQPILPPRPTGRMEATGTRQQTTWKSWPVVVIGIAVLAIIAAVILMVWPQNSPTKADAKTLAPPPAPERMDTNPLPQNGPQGQVDPPNDPWKTNPPAAPSPAPSQPSVPSVPDIDDIDPPNLADPFKGGGRGATFGPNMAAMMNAVMKHACDRLATCPNADDTVKQMCSLGSIVPSDPPPTCSAAQRCLSKVDAMPCGDIDPAATLGLLQTMQDCIDATSC